MPEFADLVVTSPSLEAQAIGAQVLAGILGLLAFGLIAIVRELRADASPRS